MKLSINIKPKYDVIIDYAILESLDRHLNIFAKNQLLVICFSSKLSVKAHSLADSLKQKKYNIQLLEINDGEAQKSIDNLSCIIDKLVDFGANGTYQGGDDSEHEIVLNFDNGDFTRNTWVTLDIPLADFTGLTAQSNIAQLIYSGGPAGATTVYVDNVYFHN